MVAFYNYFDEVSQDYMRYVQNRALENNTEGLSFVKRGDSEFVEICEYLGLDHTDVYALQFETYTGDYAPVFVSFGNLLKWFQLTRFSVDNEQTKVNFRVTSEGSVFALMPELPELYGRCQIYTEHGHTSGHYSANIADSKPATDEQAYKLLKAMLQAGYNVKRIKRYTAK